MKRETFLAILSAALAEADGELLAEAKGLVFWRERALRTERVQEFAPGQIVTWHEPAGATWHSVIDHLNQFSLSVKLGNGQTMAVPIEWVKHLTTSIEEPAAKGFGVTANAVADQYDRYVRGRTP